MGVISFDKITSYALQAELLNLAKLQQTNNC